MHSVCDNYLASKQASKQARLLFCSYVDTSLKSSSHGITEEYSFVEKHLHALTEKYISVKSNNHLRNIIDGSLLMVNGIYLWNRAADCIHRKTGDYSYIKFYNCLQNRCTVTFG